MDDINKYEKILKFRLDDADKDRARERLAWLLSGFDELDDVDVSGVEPLVSVLGLTNVMREDVVDKRVTREEILANAPEQYGGYFQGPRTIE